MHTRAIQLIATVAVVLVAGTAGGDPLAGWAGPVALAEPTTAAMFMASTFLTLRERQKQKSESRRARKQAEEAQEAEQAAGARERQAELAGGESQQRALRAARRVGRRGGARRQLLSSGAPGGSVVGTSGNLAGT